MLVAVDFGRLFFSYIDVQNAAREATSYAAIHAADDPWDEHGLSVQRLGAGAQEANVQGQGGAGTLSVERSDLLRAGQLDGRSIATPASNYRGRDLATR